MKHLAYARYVLRHKWFVLVECWSIGLYWRGIVHDWHKFLPSEWFPYVEHFHGKHAASVIHATTGYNKQDDVEDVAFNLATERHYERADHHWQSWVHRDVPTFDGQRKEFAGRMPPDCIAEMVCDWIGASRAQGHGGIEGVRRWYAANGAKMQLHPTARTLVEELLAARKLR